MSQVLLNADVGEGLATDALLYPYLDQANIACGGHAGDRQTMHTAVKHCRENHVEIGAHPSYPDRENFGRHSIKIQADALHKTLTHQVGGLVKICQENQSELSYIKPHGALYNDMMADISVYQTVLSVVQQSPLPLSLMIAATPRTEHYRQIASQMGVNIIAEAFVDRLYLSDGSLCPRSEPGAVHAEEELVIQQCKTIKDFATIRCRSGEDIVVDADTLCLHGDNPASVAAAAKIAAILNA